MTFLHTALCHLIDPAGAPSPHFYKYHLYPPAEEILFSCIVQEDIYYSEPTQMEILPLPHTVTAYTVNTHTD